VLVVRCQVLLVVRSRVTIRVLVECYAGYRGDQTPRVLVLDAQRIRVAEIVGQWLTPDHRYFKLTGDDGRVYIVRQDVGSDVWELQADG
jgi:hypothetical protein